MASPVKKSRKASTSLPIGTIIASIWPAQSPQVGWFYCDGSPLQDTATYKELAALLYDKKTLPDLRDRLPLGAHQTLSLLQYGSRTQPSSFKATGVAPEDTVFTLTIEEMPPHQHYTGSNTNSSRQYEWPFGVRYPASGTIYYMSNGNGDSGPLWATDIVGGGAALSVLPASFGVNYFIYGGP